MSILLVSLGTSPAIVPEAHLLPHVTFRSVHVLTTASIRESDLDFVAEWFAAHAPQVKLSFTRVADFRDFQSEQDHFQFEEVLYRWWLEKAAGENPYVCLSGGFKTMSAAMQKAAAVLGAREVFHVLADSIYPDPRDGNRKLPASTADQIEDSSSKGHLHWIKLGEESGWPQLRGVEPSQFPLVLGQGNGRAAWVQAPDSAFREKVREIVTRSHHIAGAWDELGNLPFPTLATWAPQQLAWLREPVKLPEDEEWIASLPKVELHCHLGGFATHGELLEQVRAAAIQPLKLQAAGPPDLPDGWPLPEVSIPLPEYMKLGDANGSKLLKDPGCLKKQCELLYAHFLEQKILYAEVRCSPANYVSEGRSPWTVLSEIKQTFDACMQARPGCHVNLLIIGTRTMKGDHRTALLRHLMLAITAAEHWPVEHAGCRVVGVDLAGFEDKETRAHYYREDFRIVHRAGLALTVHAGENDDSEGIWSAVFDLNAQRLGHALHLIDSAELMQSVADRRIAVEMCPYANFQIKGFYPMNGKGSYPLKRYLDSGICVTVNTDNIGISAASLTDNVLLLPKLCPDLTRLDLLQLLSNSTQAAFLPPAARASLRRQWQESLPRPH